jgi:hypothetical protein
MTSVKELDAEKPDLKDWKRSVLERDKSTCVNCERTRHVAASFVIPPEAGGRIRLSNGVSLCRECRIAAEGHRVLPQRIDNKTPINFLVSRRLHEAVEKFVHEQSNFGNISALIRHMISAFITSPELFDDLDMWQDDGSDIKVNGWVDGVQYECFKQLCYERNLSFTSAFKSLLLVAINDGQIKAAVSSH